MYISMWKIIHNRLYIAIMFGMFSIVTLFMTYNYDTLFYYYFDKYFNRILIRRIHCVCVLLICGTKLKFIA